MLSRVIAKNVGDVFFETQCSNMLQDKNCNSHYTDDGELRLINKNLSYVLCILNVMQINVSYLHVKKCIKMLNGTQRMPDYEVNLYLNTCTNTRS